MPLQVPTNVSSLKAFKAQQASSMNIPNAPSMDQSNPILGQASAPVPPPKYTLMAAAAMHSQGRLIQPKG